MLQAIIKNKIYILLVSETKLGYFFYKPILHLQLRANGIEIKGEGIILNIRRGIPSKSLKVVAATFLLVCFLSLKEITCEIKKNVLFHFKSFFRSRENQILEF